MSSSRPLFAAAVVGVVAAAAVLALAPRLPAARADTPPANRPATFAYQPRGAGGVAELVDTRTGAVYRRNDFSARWELYTQPLAKD